MLGMAFGISSLVFSIVAIFVPVFGVFIAGLSGILAWMSVGRAVFLGLTAVIINVLNIFLFSPTFMFLIAREVSQRTPDQSKSLNFWIIVLAIQVIAVFLFIFNSILRSFLKSRSNSNKSKQTISYGSEQSDPQDIDTPFNDSQRDTYEGSTRPGAATRLTRIIVRKTHGGRKESSGFWESGPTASPFSENTESGKKDRSERTRSPILAVILVSILALAGWAGLNFYNNGFESVPLSRVYEDAAKKTDSTIETKPTFSQPSKEGIYERDTSDQVSRKSLPKNDDKIFSWKDKDGRVRFTNANPPQNGQKVTQHPELSDSRERTSVEIVDNDVFIPITIIHNSKKLETSLQVNNDFAQSVLPARIADFLKADLLSTKSVKTIDGGEIILEKRKVDLFKVGPHVERDFLIVTQEGRRGVIRGILGQDFLMKHPYSIDYENQSIVWQ